MKKIFKLLSILSLFAMVFASCNTDAKGEIYEDRSISGVAFPSTQLNIDLLPSDNGIINVPVNRACGLTDASINISLTDATGLFLLDSPKVNFKAGEMVGYIKVKYVLATLSATKTYSVSLNITDKAQLSPSGVEQFKIVAKCKAN